MGPSMDHLRVRDESRKYLTCRPASRERDERTRVCEILSLRYSQIRLVDFSARLRYSIVSKDAVPKISTLSTSRLVASATSEQLHTLSTSLTLDTGNYSTTSVVIHVPCLTCFLRRCSLKPSVIHSFICQTFGGARLDNPQSLVIP